MHIRACLGMGVVRGEGFTKRMQVSFRGWWNYMLPWLWQCLHRCTYVKIIKIPISDMCNLVCLNKDETKYKVMSSWVINLNLIFSRKDALWFFYKESGWWVLCAFGPSKCFDSVLVLFKNKSTKFSFCLETFKVNISNSSSLLLLVRIKTHIYIYKYISLIYQKLSSYSLSKFLPVSLLLSWKDCIMLF